MISTLRQSDLTDYYNTNEGIIITITLLTRFKLSEIVSLVYPATIFLHFYPTRRRFGRNNHQLMRFLSIHDFMKEHMFNC